MKPPHRRATRRSRRGSAALPSRLGSGWLLGICFGIAFLTGLISHYAQNVSQPIPFPTSPSWGYRVTQGLHVITGTACVPLLLVKLWTVYPKLFQRPPKGARKLAARGARARLDRRAGGLRDLPAGQRAGERDRVVPVELLVPAHPLRAWPGSPSARWSCTSRSSCRSSAAPSPPTSTTRRTTGPRRRSAVCCRGAGCCGATWVATGVAVLAVAGNTVPFLRKVSIFAPHSGEGPQDLPVTKSAAAAKVQAAATELGVPARGGARRPHGHVVARAAARRWSSRPRRCRSRAWRAGRRAATGPASGCARCSTWSTHPGEGRLRDLAAGATAPSGTRPCRATSWTTSAPRWRSC